MMPHFIHTCTLSRTAPGGQDEFGLPIEETVTVSTRCRFVAPSGTVRVLESGQRVISLPGVLLPPDVDVRAGDQISTETPGYAGTYAVVAPRPAYGSRHLHHIRADLEAVE